MSDKAVRFRNAIPLLFLLITSCSSTPAAPTGTVAVSPAPTSTIAPDPVSTFTPTATAVPAPARAFYTMDVTIDYDAHTVAVDQTIRNPNHTGGQLNALVLAVEPNLWPDCFTLNGLSIDGVPTTAYSLDGQRLDIALSSFFMPETVLTIEIQYTLSLPFAEQEDPNVSRPRIFGYTRRQLNLTNWYPFVVPNLNGEWVLHEPWFYGEHLVYEAADYEVNVKFTDPATAPVVASSGFPESQADFTRYTLTAARTFALAASREFQVSTLDAGGVIVSSYYFP